MFPRRASAAMLAACLLAASCVPVAAGEPTSGTVVKIYDGDTVTIESDGTRHRCRLLGIDAPEMSYGHLRSEMEKVRKHALPEAHDELEAAQWTFEKWAAKMEAKAREARDALTAMVNGKAVRLEYDSKQPRRDRYGRPPCLRHRGRPRRERGNAQARPGCRGDAVRLQPAAGIREGLAGSAGRSHRPMGPAGRGCEHRASFSASQQRQE